MKWTDIVGHVENIKTLRYMESSKHMPHAVLLSGPSGIGKFMVASVLGAALLCISSDSRPCGSCSSCLQMQYGTHPDYLLVRPDGTAIKIEQIRKLQHEAALAPYFSSRRVCIIDSAELMTVQAANSLLKVLEEPAGEIVFILVSGNKQMLLATILSRCMAIGFQPLTDNLLAQALADRNFSPEQAEVAARLSRGRMGTALSMLEPDGFAVRNQAAKVLESLVEGSMTVVWDTAAALEKMERKDLLQVVGHFSYLLRDMLMLVTGQGLQLLFNIDLAEKLRGQAGRWSEQRLVKALQAVETARRALHGNANARLTSEALLIKIYDLVREV
ncbi:MAG: DNA polymerase III subunit delta' [Sporomusaceae bacterium]|nr:DNA polymerase III subunit delta' [Sporomusaceae bacterium]